MSTIFDTLPLTLGVIELPGLFAAMLTLLADTVGAGGVTVTLMVAVLEVPPGPLALMLRLSLPLNPELGV